MIKVTVDKIIDDSTIKAYTILSKRHPVYGKIITKKKNYLVESSGKKAEIGQVIEIKPSRPISKRKKWIVC